MAEYGFFDRLRDFLTSRRFMWIVTIAAASVLVLYFLFVTLFFNPFEDPLGDTAAVVPAEVDYFVRWRGAGEQLADFPVPRVWRAVEGSPAWPELESSGAMAALGQATGVGAVLDELEAAADYLPPGLSLQRDLLREIVVTGNGALAFDERFAGMVMLRVSLKVRAGVSMLHWGFVRDKLPEGIQVEAAGDGVYKIPQFEAFGFQDAFLTRIRDVVLLTSRRELLERARELQRRSGQESLATSSLFHDHVTAYLAPGDRPVEVFLRWREIGAQLGRWPDPNAQDFVSRLFGRFLDTSLFRYLSGYLFLDQRFEWRMSGRMDTSNAGDFQRSWLEGSPMSAVRLRQFADMTPRECFLFSGLTGDPAKLLVQLYDLGPEDMRNAFDVAVRDTGTYQSVLELLRDVGGVFEPGMALILRNNDLPEEQEGGLEHDDAPVPLWAAIARVRDEVAYERILQWLERNWRRFSDSGLQELKMAGGATGRSFPSVLFPGTGEIVVARVPTREVVIIANSARFLSQVIATTFPGTERQAEQIKLLHREDFAEALERSNNGAHLFFWFDPGNGRHWMEDFSRKLAEHLYQQEREAAWRQKRPAEEQRQRERLFDGRQNLTPQEQTRLQDAVDRALVEAEAGAEVRITELAGEIARNWLPLMALDWVGGGFRASRRGGELVISGEVDS